VDREHRQGAYAVIAETGRILKRGHDLAQVLRVLEKPLRVEVVSALEDAPGLGDHRVGALAAGEARVLLDAVEKRGHDLAQVLRVLEKPLRVV
jgi:HEPN domain-containing protein